MVAMVVATAMPAVAILVGTAAAMVAATAGAMAAGTVAAMAVGTAAAIAAAMEMGGAMGTDDPISYMQSDAEHAA